MITIAMPGLVAEFLDEAGFKDPAARKALEHGKIIRRGAGFTHMVTATLDTHRFLLEQCWVLDASSGADNTATERRAYRIYADRVRQAEQKAKRHGFTV